ncbi:hypothetical protein CMQ_4151 [Grosmannia clavigera kw1407]|uniref:Fucose-specific lectin n=1 Tax=Grosmannia clavigera (strain kw1407 / UAMH 11150) TaxID=655863 RepID=F0X8E3_GROCL|nr:uncharacterized protein CMQ_4151 [Grosmannia clavigera kw1407]EFX06082.1 hypothetical protein CMQ_4151 [Grosmannia clavigera kw1407]
MQATDDSATQLGPKAAKGSQVSVSVPVGSTDIHLFYLSENKSLASLTLNGSAWSAVLPPIPKFASDSKTSFAAAAWAESSLIVRIFYINSDKVTSKWTLLDGAEGFWVNTADTIGTRPAAKASEPVAASRSENGTGRYLEYFYTAPGGHINYLAKNYVDEPTFLIEYANFEIPTSGLTKDQKISLGTGIVGGVIGIVSIIVAIILAKDKWKWLRWFRFSTSSQKQGYTHVAPVTSATAINRNSQGPPVPHATLPW